MTYDSIFHSRGITEAFVRPLNALGPGTKYKLISQGKPTSTLVITTKKGLYQLNTSGNDSRHGYHIGSYRIVSSRISIKKV